LQTKDFYYFKFWQVSIFKTSLDRLETLTISRGQA